MNRRTLLGGIGATLGTGVAGCTGFGRADGESPTEPSETHTPPPTAGERTATETAGDELESERPTAIRETVVVPKRESAAEQISPHDLRLWNAVDSRRAVTVTVTPEPSAALSELTTAHHVPANEAVAIEFRQPATYAVAVQIEGTGVGTFEIGEERFDCNVSATTVELGADGIVDRRDTTTLVACADTTVETTANDG